MRMMRKYIPPLIVIFCLLTLKTVFSQSKGALQGTVSDIKTGETLAGANILVKGTYKGTAADLDGFYSISDISPGYYDLECSVLGYTVQIAAGIVLTPGETRVLDFEMEPTVLALGEEVIVIGEAPLLDVDNTSSARILDSEEIENSIAEDISALVAQQAGVVVVNNEIHIRGGRADENIFIIDGARVKDPISGQSYGSYISADAIEQLEVITGGFSAEYGEAMSGVVDVKIKEGGDEYSGSFTVKTDRPGFNLPQTQNTLNSEFSFGGPEPITENLRSLGIRIPGKVSFFMNGYSFISDTHLPVADQLYPSNPDYDIFAPREENNWSIIGKLSWNPDETKKATYTYDRSLQINQGYFQSVMEKKDFYPYEFQLNLDNFNTVTRESQQHTLNWKQTLSRRTFYEIMAAQLFIGVHSAVQNQDWTEYEERQDNEPIIFYPPDQNGEIEVRFGDGYYETGDNGNFHDHYSNSILLDGQITSQVNERHQVKGGFEFNYSELQMLDINDPWVDDASSLGRNYDMYRVYPSAGAFYVQDKIEYKGMIANVGLRLDYWFPGEYVVDALNNPSDAVLNTPGLAELQAATRDLYYDETFGVFGQRCKAHLSPRLGISHPVTDKDMLFFSYGHFSQRPQKSNYVYAHLKSQSQATYQLFGNPNLNPSVTVAYELGIKHKFTKDLVVEGTAFYKDHFDYITAENVSEQNPRYGSHTMYFNRDHARSRGIELKLQQRYSRYFSGRADFTYMIVTGKSSSPNTQLYIEAGLIDEKTLGEEYMSWDKPITFSADLNFRVPTGYEPYLFGWKTPGDWGGKIRFEFQSGKRYTPIVVHEDGDDIYSNDSYSEISKAVNTVDLKLYKNHRFGSLNAQIFVEIENIFNYKVPQIINPLTGEPYEPGDPIPYSWYDDPRDLPPDDPSRYRRPRQIIIGTKWRF